MMRLHGVTVPVRRLAVNVGLSPDDLFKSLYSHIFWVGRVEADI
jgi:hypothetical protein